MALLAPLLLLFITSFVQAQDIDSNLNHEQRKAFQEIEGNILSPFCPGRLLKDCPSSAARNLKFDIKRRIVSGDSREKILEALWKEYGDDLRAVPKNSGFGLVAWYAPAAFLLLGLLGLVLWVRGQTAQSSEDSA